MSGEKVDVKVNHQALPEHFRIITIVYDPQKDQMQVQGHLGDLKQAHKMLDTAKHKINEFHAKQK